jgi:putative ABC transport system permease protein
VESFRELTIGDMRRTLLILFAGVGVILLIGCANLANLLLARGLARQKEIAVRAALGASRWRLIRQLLTETTLLSLLGGIGGVLLAQWGVHGLLKLPQNFVRGEEVRLDAKVLLFALAASILTGWLFGLAPALQLAKPDLHAMLKEGGRGSGETAKWNRVRGAFVVTQVALSLLLLVGGGLLIRSFDKLLRISPGFQPEKLLTLEYRLPRNKYQKREAQWNFHRQVVERIAEVPGVKSASLVRGLPFSGNGGNAAIILPDREVPPQGKEPQVQFNTATPNYFETMGIPFIQSAGGRLFDDRDQGNTPTVFLINQTMALGARWGNILGMILRQGMTLVLIGVALGLAAAWTLTRLMATLLFGVTATDPLTYSVIAVLLTIAALLACYIPAQRATKVDPMVALRTE